MCDGGGRASQNWRVYVQDMIDFGERVVTYTAGMDQDAFITDSRTYDAVLRNIELIGEAATHVPAPVQERNPEIEWRKIIAARNRVAHGYMGVDNDVIWDIIRTDVPDLLPKLRCMLDSK